ncbi:MAG: phosphoadenosine phosphosulfate reductase family protein, partial [Promethearchaeota archaeon]
MKLLPEELFYKELDAKDFLRNYLKQSAVSLSGGKDSLVALDLSYRVGIKKFVFGNTSMVFPKTEEYIRKLEKFYDIEIIQVKPPRIFLDLVDDLGFPSQRLRWCCEVYKFGPLANYVLKEKIKCLITGIRSEESRKRRNYSKISKNPLIPAIQINPILDWSTEEIWDYIKYYKLPYHPLYDMGYNRLGCWMCPFQKKEGFKRLQTIFPNLYKALVDSLYRNVKKFGKVGVRDIDNYIKEHAWTKNALPIRNIIGGSIKYEKNKDYSKYIIRCFNKIDFLNIIENSNLLKKKSLE